LYIAYRDALHHDSDTIPDPVSICILEFFEKTAYIGVCIGAVVGVIILLNNTSRLSVNSIYRIGPHALTGTISALIIAIILKQISGIFRHPRLHRTQSEETYVDSLKWLCDAYGITPREKEIIKMIAGGLSNREICRSLDITHDTVKNHVYNIFRKTGVKNRNGLVGMLLDRKNGKSI